MLVPIYAAQIFLLVIARHPLPITRLPLSKLCQNSNTRGHHHAIPREMIRGMRRLITPIALMNVPLNIPSPRTVPDLSRVLRTLLLCRPSTSPECSFPPGTVHAFLFCVYNQSLQPSKPGAGTMLKDLISRQPQITLPISLRRMCLQLHSNRASQRCQDPAVAETTRIRKPHCPSRARTRGWSPPALLGALANLLTPDTTR